MNLSHLKHVHISTNTRPQEKKSQQILGISDTLELLIGAVPTAYSDCQKFFRFVGAQQAVPLPMCFQQVKTFGKNYELAAGKLGWGGLFASGKAR